MATLPGAWRYRSALGLVVPVSIYYNWVRWKAWSATSISLWQHVKLSEQIRPWYTLACCWDVKQPTKKQTPQTNSKDSVTFTMHMMGWGGNVLYTASTNWVTVDTYSDSLSSWRNRCGLLLACRMACTLRLDSCTQPQKSRWHNGNQQRTDWRANILTSAWVSCKLLCSEI